jgi:hypothetical protein
MRLLEYGGQLVFADWAHFQGGDVQKGLAEMAEQTNAMIDDLLWWTTALKTARGDAK